MEIRDLSDDELPFLHEMLYAALAWRPGDELPPPEWVLSHEQVEPFHRDWGRPGDVALVAEEDERLLGLVWYRLFTEDDHGEGFVDEETPELAIAVVDGLRGRGIGRSLLLAAHERARADGLARMSLSSDLDNPARRLFASAGYVEYQPNDELERMVVELT